VSATLFAVCQRYVVVAVVVVGVVVVVAVVVVVVWSRLLRAADPKAGYSVFMCALV